MAEVRVVLTALALLAAMVLAGWLGRRSSTAALVLVLLAFAWLTVDAQWELGVLVAFDDDHGITVSDLAGGTGLVVGLAELGLRWRSSRLRRRHGRRFPASAGPGDDHLGERLQSRTRRHVG